MEVRGFTIKINFSLELGLPLVGLGFRTLFGVVFCFRCSVSCSWKDLRSGQIYISGDVRKVKGGLGIWD